ncbi:hypothetical protein G6F31_014152 [Rhizopus arrhizus]|nr:hypothetical protein G6F31_014152 [Rhizopus arrhizus]
MSLSADSAACVPFINASNAASTFGSLRPQSSTVLPPTRVKKWVANGLSLQVSSRPTPESSGSPSLSHTDGSTPSSMDGSLSTTVVGAAGGPAGAAGATAGIVSTAFSGACPQAASSATISAIPAT